jgi:hypothetical protein
MITMQLTAKDIADAKHVIDAQVLNLTSDQVAALYNSLWIAAAQVGTVFDVVPMVEQPQPIVRRRLQRRKKAIKP